MLGFSMSARRIVVTSALPYSNGEIHLGHLLETVQTDIWVRFQRLSGNQCYYFCGNDTHGTPVMMRADEEGITPEALIDRVHAEHSQIFADFDVDFDLFYTTHSPESKELTEQIFNRVSKRIVRREISQLYDPVKNIFLADRYVRGNCPCCGVADQYGDHCECCGASYSAEEIKNPRSVLSDATPELRQSEHYFFDLPACQDFLQEWVKKGIPQSAVVNKVREWLDNELKQWDISRDAPYFGFLIPGTSDKYFYVWMDAPIGYMASQLKYSRDNNLEEFFDETWKSDSDIEVYHFIGKDIAHFHTLFWPALLWSSGLRPPSAVYAHGFLTVNGEKMSKTRGTFILANAFKKYIEPEYLRYFYAARLSDSVEDIDLNLQDFLTTVNSDLVGKLVNIASRCARFVNQIADSTLSEEIHNETLWKQVTSASAAIADDYENRRYSSAMRKIMALADQTNQYIDEHKPWQLIKREGSQEQVIQICSLGLNVYRSLMIYLKPVLPKLAERSESLMNAEPWNWDDAITPLRGHQINSFTPLLQRLEQKQVDQLLSANAPETEETPTMTDSGTNTIDYDTFAKVDLRVARVLKAEEVPDADKLLRLELDLGNGDTRQAFAGIKAAYTPEQIQGQLVVVVANLQPRKMRFGVSETMVLASGEGGADVHLVIPGEGASPGDKVK